MRVLPAAQHCHIPIHNSLVANWKLCSALCDESVCTLQCWHSQTCLRPFISKSTCVALRVVQGNCLTLLFAAHDTVASTMALLLRFLKHNPEALQKLRAEQRQVTILPAPLSHASLTAECTPKSCAQSCLLMFAALAPTPQVGTATSARPPQLGGLHPPRHFQALPPSPKPPQIVGLPLPPEHVLD